MSGQAYLKKPNSPVTLNRSSPGMLSPASVTVAKPAPRKARKAPRSPK